MKKRADALLWFARKSYIFFKEIASLAPESSFSKFLIVNDSIFANFKRCAFAKGYFPIRMNEQASVTPAPVVSAGSTSNLIVLLSKRVADHVQMRLLM